MRQHRKYQPIWEQIKKDKKATVLCAVPMHNRLIKAVRKEKDKDYGWKLLAAEDNKKYTLKEETKENAVVFHLEVSQVINIHTL